MFGFTYEEWESLDFDSIKKVDLFSPFSSLEVINPLIEAVALHTK